ncbi:hypothetical protein ACFY5D_19705, partial [Paeniglutamicibacter sp. NPDC012692]
VNTAVNTADNAADNAAVNTADNAAENTDVNTAVNTADNAAENTDVNTDVNTAVNTADNAAENTDVNTAVNTADNAADNAAVNTADNAAENTADNAAENTADNTEHPTLTVIPGEVEKGDSVKVIGDKFTAGGTVKIEVGNVDGSGEKVVLTDDEEIGDNGKFVFDFDSKDLAPGVYEVIATDNEGKTSSSFLVVRDKKATTNVSIDVTPKRVVKGETTLLTGWDFTADGTAEVSLLALTASAARAVPGAEILESELAVDAEGKISRRVETANLELGDYLLTAVDNSSKDKDYVTFTVVADDDSTAENNAENTSDNSGDNNDENTSDNSGDNNDENTSDNSDDNADENTDVNSGTNNADNSSVNSGANRGDNAGTSGPVKPLANTGSEGTLIVGGIAVLLLLAGGVTLMVSRKRRAL